MVFKVRLAGEKTSGIYALLLHLHITSQQNIVKMAVIQINAATHALPSDFPEKGFKATGKLSEHTQRAISPVGPYHLGASFFYTQGKDIL